MATTPPVVAPAMRHCASATTGSRSAPQLRSPRAVGTAARRQRRRPPRRRERASPMTTGEGAPDATSSSQSVSCARPNPSCHGGSNRRHGDSARDA